MFEAHGRFQVSMSGNIVRLQIEGAWNIETANAYRDAIFDAVKTLQGRPWGAITIMSDWELCTPDCAIEIYKIFLSATQQGLTREAVVNSEGHIKIELLEKLIPGDVRHNAHPAKAYQRALFEHESEAVTWLASEGFKSD